MTDEQWEKIRPLAEAETRAKLAYEAWAVVPIFQHKARIEVALAFRQAEIEWAEARHKLQAAIKEIAGVEVFV
jgi:hypothetical protein